MSTDWEIAKIAEIAEKLPTVGLRASAGWFSDHGNLLQQIDTICLSSW